MSGHSRSARTALLHPATKPGCPIHRAFVSCDEWAFAPARTALLYPATKPGCPLFDKPDLQIPHQGRELLGRLLKHNPKSNHKVSRSKTLHTLPGRGGVRLSLASPTRWPP